MPTERTKTSRRGEIGGRVYPTPLPALAQRIVKTMPRTDDDLIFPGRITGKPIWPGSPFLKKMRALSGVEDFRFHTFRDTVATFLQDQQSAEHEIGLVLNHTGGGSVTASYIHSYPLKLKHKLLKQWADHIEALIAGDGVAVLR